MATKTQACIKTAIVACLLAPSVSLADCGDFPAQPSFLSKEYIMQDELNKATEAFNQFLIDITEYQKCIDSAVSKLDFDNPESQNAALRYSHISEVLFESQSVAIDRHNQLLSNLEFAPLKAKPTQDTSDESKQSSN